MKAIFKPLIEVFFYDGTNASELANFLGGEIQDINSYNGKIYHKVWIKLPDDKEVYIHLDVNEKQVAVLVTDKEVLTMDMESFKIQCEVIENEQ